MRITHIPGPDGRLVANYRREVRLALGLDESPRDDDGRDAAERQVACLIVAAELHLVAFDCPPEDEAIEAIVQESYHAGALALLRRVFRRHLETAGDPEEEDLP